jgi:hypothetical protein
MEGEDDMKITIYVGKEIYDKIRKTGKNVNDFFGDLLTDHFYSGEKKVEEVVEVESTDTIKVPKAVPNAEKKRSEEQPKKEKEAQFPYAKKSKKKMDKN